MAKRSKKASPIGTVLTYTYGSAEITGFDGARRVDVYTPFEVNPREPWNNKVTERAMCLDHEDATPVVQTYAAQCGVEADFVRHYDSKCSCCYLNISHTTALHDARVGFNKLAGVAL